MRLSEKVTFQVEKGAHEELEAWAREECRAVGNLIRLIVTRSLADRRRRQTKPAAA